MLFLQVCLHATTSTHCFYARILLRKGSFTRRNFYAETLRHPVAGAFAWKYFYTAMFIARAFFFTYAHALPQGCFESHMLFNHTCFCTEMFCTETPSHKDAFAQECFHTQKCLFTQKHLNFREIILHWAILHADAKTNKGMYVHEELLPTRIFTTTAWFPTADTHMVRKSSAGKHMQNHGQFHHSFWQSWRILRERVGPAQAHIAI